MKILNSSSSMGRGIRLQWLVKSLVMLSLVLLVVLPGFLVGCRVTSDATKTPADSTAFPITVTDDLGRVVTIDKAPAKIVSLAPSNTEIVFALGLGDRLVGVTQSCNYPEEALQKDKIGDFAQIDMERIVVIDPDLILATDIHKQDVIPGLEQLGFTVISLVPHNLDEVMASITLIGRVTGAPEEASRLVADMSRRIEAVTAETAGLTEAQRPRVLYVIWHEPLMSVGTTTRIHELIEKAGGINIARFAGEGYPTLALEEVIGADPQVVVTDNDISLQFLLDEPRLDGVDAWVNGRIFGIDADIINRPTPRIVEALEWLASLIHPGIFGPVE